MTSMISSVESKPFGLLPKPFIEGSSRVMHLASFFRTNDMAQLCSRQSMFIPILLGGRVVYTGKDIHAAHAHALGQALNEGHFDRFLRHFRETLNEVGVKAQKVEKVANLPETGRNAVLKS